jgi:hypothetical protein
VVEHGAARDGAQERALVRDDEARGDPEDDVQQGVGLRRERERARRARGVQVPRVEV